MEWTGNIDGLVSKLSRLFAAALQTRMAPHGVLAGQLPVLVHLWEEDGLTQSELCELVGVEQPTMANTIKRMERDGLVKKRRDNLDRRKFRVLLTPRAKELKPILESCVDEVRELAAEGIDPRALRVMAGAMERMEENLRLDAEPPLVLDDIFVAEVVTETVPAPVLAGAASAGQSGAEAEGDAPEPAVERDEAVEPLVSEPESPPVSEPQIVPEPDHTSEPEAVHEPEPEAVHEPVEQADEPEHAGTGTPDTEPAGDTVSTSRADLGQGQSDAESDSPDAESVRLHAEPNSLDAEPGQTPDAEPVRADTEPGRGDDTEGAEPSGATAAALQGGEPGDSFSKKVAETDEQALADVEPDASGAIPVGATAAGPGPGIVDSVNEEPAEDAAEAVLELEDMVLELDDPVSEEGFDGAGEISPRSLSTFDDATLVTPDTVRAGRSAGSVRHGLTEAQQETSSGSDATGHDATGHDAAVPDAATQGEDARTGELDPSSHMGDGPQKAEMDTPPFATGDDEPVLELAADAILEDSQSQSDSRNHLSENGNLSENGSDDRHESVSGQDAAIRAPHVGAASGDRLGHGLPGHGQEASVAAKTENPDAGAFARGLERQRSKAGSAVGPEGTDLLARQSGMGTGSTGAGSSSAQDDADDIWGDFGPESMGEESLVTLYEEGGPSDTGQGASFAGLAAPTDASDEATAGNEATQGSPSSEDDALELLLEDADSSLPAGGETDAAAPVEAGPGGADDAGADDTGDGYLDALFLSEDGLEADQTSQDAAPAETLPPNTSTDTPADTSGELEGLELSDLLPDDVREGGEDLPLSGGHDSYGGQGGFGAQPGGGDQEWSEELGMTGGQGMTDEQDMTGELGLAGDDVHAGRQSDAGAESSSMLDDARLVTSDDPAAGAARTGGTAAGAGSAEETDELLDVLFSEEDTASSRVEDTSSHPSDRERQAEEDALLERELVAQALLEELWGGTEPEVPAEETPRHPGAQGPGRGDDAEPGRKAGAPEEERLLVSRKQVAKEQVAREQVTEEKDESDDAPLILSDKLRLEE